MFGERLEEAKPIEGLVICDLPSLPNCDCTDVTAYPEEGSSSKRKVSSQSIPLIAPEYLCPSTAKRLALSQPSLVDRLISWNKSSLTMEGRRSIKKNQSPAKNAGEASGSSALVPAKRRRAKSLTSTVPAVKRLRNSKGGSESDSSPSACEPAEKKARNAEKVPKERSQNSDKNDQKVTKASVSDKRQASGKLPENKTDKTLMPKKMLKKGESRFSKRIRFSTSSLRSGKKRQELDDSKKLSKTPTKDLKDKRKPSTSEKTDSNYNVCTENESENEAGENSTDSEVSRYQSDCTDDKEKNQEVEENVTKKRKRRKRDSMWVKKVKKQLKGKPETDKSVVPPTLMPEGIIEPVVADEESDEKEEKDLPILDRSDDSINISNDTTFNDSLPDDVSMPKLEVQTFTAILKDGQKEPSISSVNPLSKPEEKHAGQPALGVETQNTETQFEPQSEPVPLIEHAKCDEIEEQKKVPEVSSYETDISKLPEQGDKNELTNDKPVKECQPSVVDLASLNPVECETNKQLESLKSTMGEGAQEGEEKSKVSLDVPHDRERPSITEILKTECINAMQQAFASSLKDASETIDDKEEKASEVNVEKVETQADLANDNEVITRLNDNDVEVPQQSVPNESSKAVSEDTFLGTAAKSDAKNNEIVQSPEEQNNICGKSQELKIDQTPNQSETATHLSLSVPDENQEPISSPVSINQEIQNAVEGTLPTSQSVTDNTSEEVLNGPPSSCASPVSFNNMESYITSNDPINIIQNNMDLSKVHTNGCTSENTPHNLFEKEKDSLVSNKDSGSLPCATQCLDSESSKMDSIPNGEPVVCDTNPNSGTKTPEAQNSAGETKLMSNEPSGLVQELNDANGILDPDSTSDVKPPALDDSFTSLSLTFPEDLDLEEERTQSERDEKDVLPDSTLSEKSGAEINYEDESGGKEDSLCMASEEISVKQEVKSPEPVRVEETTELSVIPEKRDNASLQESKISEDIQSIRTSLEELQSKEKVGLQILPEVKAETLTLEERQRKESVLQALGLKSLSTTYRAPEEKPKRDGYTGTLKAVIKLNRTGDKKKMVYQRSEDAKGELEYRICSEILSTDTVPITHLNDINGMPKIIAKHNQESDVKIGSASSNGLTDDNDSSAEDAKAGEKDLVIPEKSASFSIHPGRLCSDVCTYCFGKFGSLDTPCHVAQLKAERQKKILESEPHLTAESCLCDACYRYVDRRANCPSGGAPRQRVKPPAMSTCCVRDCSESATHTVKKKWLVKLKKSITNKLDIDLDRPGAMYYPLCAQHHYWVEYFTVCGICRKRLNRNHLYSLGSETDRLNLMLAEDGIPARLSDKLFLCKLCRYYSNLRLKYPDPSSIPTSGQAFYRDYRRKILTSFDIPVSDSEDETVVKEEKKKAGVEKKMESSSSASTAPAAGCSSSKSDESVMALSNLATLLGDQPEQQTRIQVKFGNVNIGRLSNLNIGQGGREERTPYPDIALQANLDFKGPEEPTGSWERCVSTIQFDKRTKKLWQDLQKPYGNQSSFLRHLVMLEKYWRSGQLTLTPSADEKVVKYLNGVRNRVKAFEGSSNTVTTTERPPVTVTPVSATSAPLPTPFSSPAVTISNVPASNPVKFPPLPNTGEVEVTPITSIKRQSLPASVLGEKKPLTLLDRAKSLVRMVPPTPPRQRFPVNVQRYPVPMFNHPSYSYAQQQQQQHLQLQQQQHLQYQQHQQQLQLKPPAPGLIKIRNKPPPPYYQQIMAAQAAAPRPLTSTVTVRPVVAPKLPKALTVTQVPPGRAAITLNRSGITIEKEVGNVITPTIPNEKPSISVFREPAPGPS